jgi:hypothetical protein
MPDAQEEQENDQHQRGAEQPEKNEDHRFSP